MNLSANFSEFGNASFIANKVLAVSNTTVHTLPGAAANPYAPYTLGQIRKSYYFQFILYPILLLCCTVGNVLNLVVLGKTKKKGSTNAYMMTVAIANLFVLWLYLPNWIYNVGGKKQTGYLVSFYNFYGLQQWGIDTFIHLSDWTLIVFSLERLMAITKPLSFRQFQSAKYARIISAILLILGGAATFYNVFSWYYFKYYLKADNPNAKGVNKTYYASRKNPQIERWEEIQSASEVAITLGKFFALLLINIFVVAVIVHMSKSFSMGNKSGDQKRRQKQQRNSILILLGSVALYLLTQFPTVVYNILLIAKAQGTYTALTLGHQYMTATFVQPIQQINYALNFFIYVTVSDQFRHQFMIVFGKTAFVRFFVDRKRKLAHVASPEKTEIGQNPENLRSTRGSVVSNLSDVSQVDVSSSGTDSNSNDATPAVGLATLLKQAPNLPGLELAANVQVIQETSFDIKADGQGPGKTNAEDTDGKEFLPQESETDRKSRAETDAAFFKSGFVHERSSLEIHDNAKSHSLVRAADADSGIEDNLGTRKEDECLDEISNGGATPRPHLVEPDIDPTERSWVPGPKMGHESNNDFLRTAAAAGERAAEVDATRHDISAENVPTVMLNDPKPRDAGANRVMSSHGHPGDYGDHARLSPRAIRGRDTGPEPREQATTVL